MIRAQGRSTTFRAATANRNFCSGGRADAGRGLRGRVGGTETYGKFVADPYPALIERIGLPVVNFGCVNAGIDVFVSEPTMIDAASGAA